VQGVPPLLKNSKEVEVGRLRLLGAKVDQFFLSACNQLNEHADDLAAAARKQAAEDSDDIMEID
jgi:hypothetical protein